MSIVCPTYPLDSHHLPSVNSLLVALYKGSKCYIFGLLLCLLYAGYHWDCIISLSQSLHKVLTLILVPLYRDLCYHCMIWSDSSLSVQYNLLQVLFVCLYPFKCALGCMTLCGTCTTQFDPSNLLLYNSFDLTFDTVADDFGYVCLDKGKGS